MNDNRRKEVIVSACGLNCGLCSRFYTNGASRCSGCDGDELGYCCLRCGVLKCCKNKNIDYCYLCQDYPCSKYKNALKDSFITHQNIFTNFKEIKQIGLDFYLNNLRQKMDILEKLLANYDDGRRKSFYCLAINLLDLNSIKDIMRNIENDIDLQNIDLKEQVKKIVSLFESKAIDNNIILKLNK